MTHIINSSSLERLMSCTLAPTFLCVTDQSRVGVAVPSAAWAEKSLRWFGCYPLLHFLFVLVGKASLKNPASFSLTAYFQRTILLHFIKAIYCTNTVLRFFLTRLVKTRKYVCKKKLPFLEDDVDEKKIYYSEFIRERKQSQISADCLQRRRHIFFVHFPEARANVQFSSSTCRIYSYGLKK